MDAKEKSKLKYLSIDLMEFAQDLSSIEEYSYIAINSSDQKELEDTIKQLGEYIELLRTPLEHINKILNDNYSN